MPPTLLPWRSQTKTNCGASYQCTPTSDQLLKINVNYSYSLHEKSIKVTGCWWRLPSLWKLNDQINFFFLKGSVRGNCILADIILYCFFFCFFWGVGTQSEIQWGPTRLNTFTHEAENSINPVLQLSVTLMF